jgi:hypothetical protein
MPQEDIKALAHHTIIISITIKQWGHKQTLAGA